MSFGNGYRGTSSPPPDAPGGGEEIPVILIADDDPMSRRLLEAALGVLGDCEFIRAGDGAEALEMFQQKTPDIILLDVFMPNMDGFEFIHEFRKFPGSDSVPVLLVSGFADISDRIRGLDLGAIDYLSKPLEPMEVALRVKSHLEKRRLYKEVEKQREYLADQAKVLDAILNSLPSGLALLDEELRITSHNQQFKRLFLNVGESEMMEGKYFSDICFAEMAALGRARARQNNLVVDILLRVLHEGIDVQHHEIPFSGGENGDDLRYMLAMATRLPLRSGQLLLDLRDISDQKKAAQKMAHRDRMATLGDLSVGVAHEINNPNAFVRVNAGNIRKILEHLAPVFEEVIKKDSELKVGTLPFEKIPQQLNKAVKSILDATDRVSTVVERLKTFGRPENLEAEDVDLSAALENAAAIVSYKLKQVEEAEIRLPENPIPPVRGTLVEFEQVIINLLTNSVDAIEQMRHNGPDDFEGRLSAWLETAGEFVSLCVKDNGIGIDDATISKIYTPYFTTKERGNGTGIGLSISHGIIGKYSGKIEVISSPHEGSTFKVFFPVEVPDGEEISLSGANA